MSIAIITGASTGIGEALARELHRRGWSVGLVARRRELLDGLATDLGSRVVVCAADVADPDALSAAVRAIETALGPCDLMVANAGVAVRMSARGFDAVAAARIMRVNYEGVLNAFAAVLPGMLARGAGQLAAVSSLAGYRGLPRLGPYSASKAAVSNLCEALRVELAPKGIAVTTVHPGYVDTPMNADNPAPMPFSLCAARAARVIADGLARRKRQINFAWQTALAMRLVRLLPDWIFDRLIPYALR